MSVAWIAGGIALAGGYFLAPRAPRWWATRRLRARCRERRTVVLTYDDGPSAGVTPRVLDLLRAHEARATFFPQGARLGECPGVAARLANEGHEVGSHSHDHLHAWRATPWSVVRDIARGCESARRHGGAERPLFRPPYGKTNAVSWSYLVLRRIPLAWWTHDSGDTWGVLPGPDDFADRVIREGGGVVLMHDSDRTPERNEYVLAATRALLTRARAAGMRFARYSDVGG